MSKLAVKGTARKSKNAAPIKEAVVRLSVFTASGAFLSLPIWINIESAQSKGLVSAAIGVGFVVWAALCAEVAFNGMRKRRWIQTLIGITLCLPFVGVNGMNAIGNLSAHSDQSRDAAKEKMQAAANISSQRAALTERRKEHANLAGEATPESIEADIKAKKVEGAIYWKWSNGCDPDKITLSETKKLCRQIADLEAKRAAAAKRDVIDVELAKITEKAEAKGAAPSTVDSFADSMTAALKELGYGVDENTKLAVVRFRDWAFSIGVEIVGTFAYSVLALLFLHKDEPTAPRPVARSNARLALPRSRTPSIPPATAPVFEEPGDVEEWFGQCARVVNGKSVRSGSAHKAYVQWCEDGAKTALNLSRFGETMRDVIIPSNPGVGKFVKHKDHFYTGFELVTPAATVSASVAPQAWTPRIVGSTT